jgi:HEPN domain-containing protein
MSSGPYSQAQILLIKASEDERALWAENVPESVFGFHAQQAVEKLIKALLSELSVPYQRTHNLAKLDALLHAAGEALPATPLGLSELEDFAVVYRYDLLFQSSGPDKAALIETVRLIREHVVARIVALSGAPLPPPVQ